MNMRRILLFRALVLIVFLIGCQSNNQKRIFDPNTKIFKVESNDIHECPLILTAGYLGLFNIDNKIWVVDYMAYTDFAIYELSGEEYSRARGYIKMGKGPGEIVRPGGMTAHNKLLFINDDGRSSIWICNFDSLIHVPNYTPVKELTMKNSILLRDFFFIDDSNVVSNAIYPLSTSSFEKKIVKGNIYTGKFKPFGYEHPEAMGNKISSSTFLRLSNGGYVRCYYWLDLITILNSDGSLRCNIYGPLWGKNKNFDYVFCYKGVSEYNGYILVPYIGDKCIRVDETQREVGNLPSRILVFDGFGNYKCTINIREMFKGMEVDLSKKRIVLSLAERDAMLGYIDLEPIFRNIR